MEKIKQEKGVTLTALVITIIVLIILAGVSINAILGESGIIKMAKKAKDSMELAQIEEQTELNEIYKQIQEGGTSENIGNIVSEPELVTITKTINFTVSAWSSYDATISFSEFSNLIGITEMSGRAGYGGSSPITVNRANKTVTFTYHNNCDITVEVNNISVTAIGIR